MIEPILMSIFVIGIGLFVGHFCRSNILEKMYEEELKNSPEPPEGIRITPW